MLEYVRNNTEVRLITAHVLPDNMASLRCLIKNGFGYLLVKDFELRLEDDNLITLCRKHHEEAEAGEYEPDYLRGLARASGKD